LLHTQRQLARDVEAAGGVKVFIGSKHELSGILACREELHRKQADTI
jgi:hypothetical protein